MLLFLLIDDADDFMDSIIPLFWTAWNNPFRCDTILPGESSEEMDMELKKLGNTDIWVTPIGFGVLTIGKTQLNLSLEEGARLIRYGQIGRAHV